MRGLLLRSTLLGLALGLACSPEEECPRDVCAHEATVETDHGELRFTRGFLSVSHSDLDRCFRAITLRLLAPMDGCGFEIKAGDVALSTTRFELDSFWFESGAHCTPFPEALQQAYAYHGTVKERSWIELRGDVPSTNESEVCLPGATLHLEGVVESPSGDPDVPTFTIPPQDIDLDLPYISTLFDPQAEGCPEIVPE